MACAQHKHIHEETTNLDTIHVFELGERLESAHQSNISRRWSAIKRRAFHCWVRSRERLELDAQFLRRDFLQAFGPSRRLKTEKLRPRKCKQLNLSTRKTFLSVDSSREVLRGGVGELAEHVIK
jgi:hypothetical protein